MLDKYFPLYVIVFLISFGATVLIEKRLVPSLAEKAKQPIYAEGPRWHLKKSGTPTMGGIAFLISVLAAVIFATLALFNKNNTELILSLIISLVFAALNSAIGIIDDMKKLRRKNNLGLSPSQKLILQFTLAALFLVARYYLLGDKGTLSFSFGEVTPGPIYYPLSLIILVGIINCANITDGIDGLASSVAFSIGVSLLFISAALNTATGVLATAIIGSALGFLVFNLHPARIFMGDTGSLFFGALIATCGFTLNNPILTVFVAGVYVLEGCSVILQVAWYKLFKKRIFKMAPIHHHYEQCGWSENKICIVAMLLTFLFSIPAYIFYLP